MSSENEEDRGKKRRREGEKEEKETERRLLNFLVKGKIGKVVVIFLGKTSWISLRTCLVVPDVTDVLVSPSSVEFLLLLGLGICGTAVLFFLQQACSLLDSYAGRHK